MDPLLLLKAVSVALTAGALSFVLAEWRFYRRSFQGATDMLGHAPDTARLIRRTVGSALLLTMSVLMFLGRLPQPGATAPDEVLRLFYYWMSVFGLAMALGLVALIDALSGMRKLGSVMSVDQARELSLLAAQLREAQIDPALLEPLEVAKSVEDQNLRSD